MTRTGLLRNRGLAALVLAVAAYASAKALLPAGPPQAAAGHGLLILVGLAWAVFICFAIAIRSDFPPDRGVFAAIGGALILASVGLLLPRATTAVIAARLAGAALWAVAALGSLGVLLRGCGSAPR